MKLNFKTEWVIIAGLATLLLVEQQCNKHNCPEETVRIDTIVRADSIPYGVLVKVPIPRYVTATPFVFPPKEEKGKTAILPTTIETSHIPPLGGTEGGFGGSFVYYSDTLKNDSSAFISLNEILSGNRIIDRQLFFANRRSTILKTITQAEAKKWKFYGGAMVTVPTTLDNQMSYGLQLLATDKKNHAYSLGYDFVNKSVVVSANWKIK